MTVIYRGIIAGEPVGKGRPRVTSRGTFTPKRTREWTNYAVKVLVWGWKGAPPLGVPVKVTVTAIKSRPQRLQRKADPDGLMWRPRKPDADNVAKSLCDALTKAGVITDDAIVVHLVAYSLYAEKNGTPRVEVEVSTVEAF